MKQKDRENRAMALRWWSIKSIEEKTELVLSQIKDLKKGDEIIVHKPSQKGEGINTPVIFLDYNRMWDWVIVKKDGKELKVGVVQDPQEDDIFIEKITFKSE